MREIMVIGSHVYGAYIRCDTLPRTGETVAGYGFDGFVSDDGGKGSNQAFCAARLGAATTFLGMVGCDVQGLEGMRSLAAVGCDVSHVKRAEGLSTGVSVAIIDRQGQSMIVTDPGANDALTEEFVEAHATVIAGHRYCLLQFETPARVALNAARKARRLGVRAVVTPGPMQALQLGDLAGIDILIPNETEAAALLDGSDVDAIGTKTADAIAAKWEVENVIVTRGAKGVVALWDHKRYNVPAFAVEARNSIGAGDGFAAAMSVALARDVPFEGALQFASAVAALVVQNPGAPWSSYPDESAVRSFLARNGLAGLADAVFA